MDKDTKERLLHLMAEVDVECERADNGGFLHSWDCEGKIWRPRDAMRSLLKELVGALTTADQD